MPTYTCPLCKSGFKKYGWFLKHINSYSQEEREKIFINDLKIYIQSNLNQFIPQGEK